MLPCKWFYPTHAFVDYSSSQSVRCIAVINILNVETSFQNGELFFHKKKKMKKMTK